MIGAEVEGIDLSQPIDQPTFELIKQAFTDAGVLIVRNQNLDPDQFLGFARRFGPDEPYTSHLSEFLMPGHPEIIMLSNIVENGQRLGVQDAGQYWHTDRSYVAQPAWSSMLYSRQVPHDDSGNPLGDTLFASTVAALAALPPEECERLAKLYVRHEYVFRFSKPNDTLPGVTHPLILRHPLSGAQCLYVNAGFTQRILDVSPEESRALLEHLYEHTAREEFVYRHQWRVGDVLMWDNYSTVHNAVGDYGPHQHRLMWRTTIKGFPLQQTALAA
jgi:taurine dioxygenase